MRKLMFLLLVSCIALQLQAQQLTVAGKVVNENGTPLPSANIKVQGTTTAIVTDSLGMFSIQVPNKQAKLEISYIGYTTQEISVQNGNNITVTMAQNTGGLNDVIVVGYGTQKRTSISGAVGTVNASEIRANVIDNTTNAITGRTPGVRVTQLSSQPGQFKSSIDIRGFATYNNDGINPTQSGGPLFVINGVPTTDQTVLGRLDPNEIESLSVLKDATAAIYGVQAANGVILITTRKGREGKMQVSYTGNYGVQVIQKYPQIVNAAEYAFLYDQKQVDDNLAGRSNPITPLYSQEQIDAFRAGTLASADWINVLFRKRSPQQQHNLTISGGSEHIQYFTSLGYYQSEGAFASGIDGDKKYNLRQNVTATLAKGLTAEINLGFNNVVYSQSSNTLWTMIKAAFGGIPPVEPVYLNNDPNYIKQFDPTLTKNPNLAAQINRDLSGYDDNNSRQLSSIFSLNYILPWVQGLSVKGLFGYTNNYTKDKNFAKAFNEYSLVNGAPTPQLFNAPSTLHEQFNQSASRDVQLSVMYNRTFGKSNINALGLFEQIYNTNDYQFSQIQYTVDAIQTLNAGNANTAISQGSYGANGNESFVGKVVYTYANKYNLEGGFREEGSSYFAPGNRWGFFPYGAASWRISEEPFIKDHLKWVDNIKLRGSYGLLGDDAAAAAGFPLFATGYIYPATGNVYASGGSTVGTVFGNSGGITKGVDFKSVAAKDLTWYTSKTVDVGLEISLWNSKLTFEGDVFRRNRTGLLAVPIVAIPTTFGASIPAQNINSDRTEGFELTLGHNSKLGNVNFHVSANMGFSRTQLLHYEESQATSPFDVYRNKFTNRYADQIWGYVVTGQFKDYPQIYSAPIQDGAGNRTLLPGDLMYADLNGDGVINQYDQKVIGTGGNRPLVYFGVNFSFAWKGFDISALLQGATKYDLTYQDQMGRPFFNSAAPLSIYTNSWHLSDVYEGTSAWIPGKTDAWVPGKYPAMGERQNYKGIGWQQISSGAGTSMYVVNGNTFNVYDGTYVRLKQLQIGYTIAPKLIKRIGISSFRLFATGYNILTWTKSPNLKWVDPEYTNTYIYGYNYPISSNYNLGVNITF